MAKRQFVLLAHTIDDSITMDHRSLNGWFLSEKLDGLRVVWDGGISRGLPVNKVPFANTQRDGRYINQDYLATGLWSRNAKVIRAPDWFLDKLPQIPLDGEIYGGRGNWEITSSITKQIEPNDQDWQRIQYCVFDSPVFDIIFGDGTIKTEIYTQVFDTQIRVWAESRAFEKGIDGRGPSNRAFEFVIGWLKKHNVENEFVKIVHQERLPYASDECNLIINQTMQNIVQQGGEGIMLRNGSSYWMPERSHQLLKLKPWFDSEAIVVGYVWGRETNKGSRLLGKLGAMVVQWNDKVFELSGFTDAEREIIITENGDTAYDIGKTMPGQPVPLSCSSKLFPVGSTVTFRYRELTAAGIPKSGQFLRKA